MEMEAEVVETPIGIIVLRKKLEFVVKNVLGK